MPNVHSSQIFMKFDMMVEDRLNVKLDFSYITVNPVGGPRMFTGAGTHKPMGWLS